MKKNKIEGEIKVNSYFNSKTKQDIALNMAKLLARLVNRELEDINGAEK